MEKTGVSLGMNILMVSNKFLPNLGGVQTQIRMFARELMKQHDVEIATLLPDDRNDCEESVSITALRHSQRERRLLERLRSLPTRYTTARSWLPRQIYRSIYFQQLRALIQGRDVVHALSTGYLSWIALEAARAENVPFVLSPYIHPRREAHLVTKQQGEVKLCNRADVVIALLETDRAALAQLGVQSERIRLAGVVPLLPEKTDPQGFRRRHGLEHKPVVLFAGRLVEYKGPRTILEATQRIWQQVPEAHFIFMGPATEQSAAWFSERRDPRIRYLGLVDEQEKGDAMAACDVFCMPSIEEILPAVYLEAWSYGKPVIGGTANGLRELIEGNGAGVVVSLDADGLANHLVQLLLNAPLRIQMGSRGQALVASRFSKSAVVRDLLSAYEVAQRRRGRNITQSWTHAAANCPSSS